jgi:hypothetical protein
MTPSLNNATMENEVLERTGRLLVQMHQHYLLVLLHQPYVIQKLCSDFDTDDLQLSAGSTYSTLAAASASREMITRYLELRGYHRSPSSRAIDDKCFLASITLLFAHLVGHRLSSMNVLEHQRCHDLGIIERVIDFMKEISILNDNPLAAARSHALSNLLKTEAHVADNLPYHIWIEDEMNTSGTRDVEGTLHEFQISVPYCGNVSISRQLRQDSLAEGVWNADVFDSATIAPDLIDSHSTLAVADGSSLAIEGLSSLQTYSD